MDAGTIEARLTGMPVAAAVEGGAHPALRGQAFDVLRRPRNRPTIGNIILSDAEFFDEKNYFTATAAGISFAPTVAKQKYFPDLTDLSSERVDGLRADQKSGPGWTRPGPAQGAEQDAVGGLPARAADLAFEDVELVAECQHLRPPPESDCGESVWRPARSGPWSTAG